MLSNEEKEFVKSTLEGCINLATLNAMTYVIKAIEGLKRLDSKCKDPLTLQQVCGYLMTYFDEVINRMENQK